MTPRHELPFLIQPSRLSQGDTIGTRVAQRASGIVRTLAKSYRLVVPTVIFSGVLNLYDLWFHGGEIASLREEIAVLKAKLIGGN